MVVHDVGGDVFVGGVLRMRRSCLGGCTLVWFGGELDVAQAVEARAFLDATVLDATVLDGRAQVVVDVSQLAFVDAAGIGVLVGAARRAARDGGSLGLVGARPMLRRMLVILRLTSVLVVYESVDSAVAASR